MKINCVVVTYNRLSLLKECLSALENQTYPIQRIVIVDNCSTDGTSEFLDSLTDTRYLIIHSKENIGGAGGFPSVQFTWLQTNPTFSSNEVTFTSSSKAVEEGIVSSSINHV